MSKAKKTVILVAASLVGSNLFGNVYLALLPLIQSNGTASNQELFALLFASVNAALFLALVFCFVPWKKEAKGLPELPPI